MYLVIGQVVNLIAPPVFLAIHVVLFLVGGFLAYRSFNAGVAGLGWVSASSRSPRSHT